MLKAKVRKKSILAHTVEGGVVVIAAGAGGRDEYWYSACHLLFITWDPRPQAEATHTQSMPHSEVSFSKPL